MRFHFVPMTPEYASRILTWRYPPPYDLYNYDKAAEHMCLNCTPLFGHKKGERN